VGSITEKRRAATMIRIGAPQDCGDLCHTARHAGPHRAVRKVEVTWPGVECLAEQQRQFHAKWISSIRAPVKAG
jgi:hypothetical protein